MTPLELRARREAAGISQAELAAAAGVSVDTLWRAERGHGRRLPALQLAICAALERLELLDEADKIITAKILDTP